MLPILHFLSFMVLFGSIYFLAFVTAKHYIEKLFVVIVAFTSQKKHAL